MAKSSKTKAFSLASETEVFSLLTDMEKDSRYNTQTRYIADTAKYPTNIITFAEQHLEHLRKFPDVNPYQYISNLKLMTKL
jgi:hypothetical protein